MNGHVNGYADVVGYMVGRYGSIDTWTDALGDQMCGWIVGTMHTTHIQTQTYFILVWTYATYHMFNHCLEMHHLTRSIVTDVHFNPLHPQLASCSFDGTIRFYSV